MISFNRLAIVALAGTAALSLNVSNASAAVMYYDSSYNSGPVVDQPGPGNEGNDPFPDSLFESPALSKCDMGSSGASISNDVTCSNWLDATDDRGAEGDYSSAFSLTYKSESSFTWSFNPDAVTGTDDILFPTFIAIKSGGGGGDFSTGYVVFDVDEMVGSIGETLVDVSQWYNNISHVSFYDGGGDCVPGDGECPPVDVVPLPAGLPLILAGMGALGVLRMRKKRS